ncbi:epoxide hydrolase [Fodinicola feengrottensis]|uniref:Epoxide hydrolase n=2 Tax=Fodinicola feengrottensis TaxID=435914 RepID=A0ABN2IMY4_9ACTN
MPAPPVLDGGETADTISRIEELVRYWRDSYDWRRQEKRLNAFPQFRSSTGLHYLRIPGTGRDPLPLLLTNGWPSSFVEYLNVLGPLSANFTVVVPTLPGFGFSDRYATDDVSQELVADLFDQLMVSELGHRHYVAHGDDIGGGIVNRLGQHHADSVLAIQTANPLSPPAALTDAERDFVAAEQEWDATEGAYAHVQETRPQILAYGLNDSPLGLAAWILEKFLTWSDPATRDQLSADDLLTTVMIYWVTETISTSMRRYALPYKPLLPGESVPVPTSVLLPHEPKLPVPPESWLRRAYPNLTRRVVLGEGGHFLALESPSRFVAEIEAAFRPYFPSPDKP